MHTSIWIKLGMALGFSFIGLFAINMIGDWTGQSDGGHPEPAHVADAVHEDTAVAAHTPPAQTGHADTAPAETDTVDTTAPAVPANGEEMPGEEPAADAIADVAVVAMAGDAEAGAKSAKKKCGTCHTFGSGEGNKVGPNLFGIMERGRAALEGYKYSAGLKAMGGFWSDADLDAFLTDPKGFSKGSKMSLKTRKEEDRADFIAYLKTLQ